MGFIGMGRVGSLFGNGREGAWVAGTGPPTGGSHGYCSPVDVVAVLVELETTFAAI